MVTRTINQTPYGLRLTYAAEGERLWTEYIPLNLVGADIDSSPRAELTWSQRVFQSLKRVVRAA